MAQEGTVPFRVYWSEVDDLDTEFIDNLFVQVINDQVYLTFGQMQIPIDINPEDPATVEIRPMARMVVSPAALEKFAKVLTKSQKDYEKREAQ